jgi:hypothetical protein
MLLLGLETVSTEDILAENVGQDHRRMRTCSLRELLQGIHC